MQQSSLRSFLESFVRNTPTDWLELTTHRLDIYNEANAKTEFLELFDDLYSKGKANKKDLEALPTAYDYIRLGHPLSCVLEWAIAKSLNASPSQVISFASQVTPILAVLRANRLKNIPTLIIAEDQMPASFDAEVIQNQYGYNFEICSREEAKGKTEFKGARLFVKASQEVYSFDIIRNADFVLNIDPISGGVLFVSDECAEDYVSEIQHVRRRETIAMTPIHSFMALEKMAGLTPSYLSIPRERNKERVLRMIQEITGSSTQAVAGSSGLSVQYAIMMGLIHFANDKYAGKPIQFIVPTNCYGGTNDQARRVADCLEHVEVVDLLVDGEHDMVNSLEQLLQESAKIDAVPYIIAEIPTNPRVEVPKLEALLETLKNKRITAEGNVAIDPVFILDQTFCPNIQFLCEGEILSSVRALSYASGSKFPSGGKCTAGYCIGNSHTKTLMQYIEQHLVLCDNEATGLQYHYLAEQLPSMNERIAAAYKNTRSFVDYIEKLLPEAKINFVSQELAERGFTPSVFSLDLPTKGNSQQEREAYKRALNHKLIALMIHEIPNESKYCVSYGQLKGCYWTIPATSTQGTTKEGDKDYIARVALSANMDLEKHKAVFKEFVDGIESPQ